MKEPTSPRNSADLPTTTRRPDLRHISLATRGWLDRFARVTARAGLEPTERLELFLALPPGEQGDHFAQLAEHERQERILDGDLEERQPQQPRKALGRSPRGDSLRRSLREARAADVFEQIPPPEYWEALTGDHVPVDGLVRCPMPGHEDVHPSCIVYPDPGAGWWCPVCDAGGSAIDLAEVITGIKARGRGYLRLREWVAERLLNRPIRSAA